MMEIREYRRAVRCERGGRLRRCRRPLAGQCQYCALGFCERHGMVLEDGQQVCGGKLCQAKRVDVERHLAFKTEALGRNEGGRCGMPGCGVGYARDCERCLRRYCVGHLGEVMVDVVRGTERGVEVLRLCEHCRGRVGLWG